MQAEDWEVKEKNVHRWTDEAFHNCEYHNFDVHTQVFKTVLTHKKESLGCYLSVKKAYLFNFYWIIICIYKST